MGARVRQARLWLLLLVASSASHGADILFESESDETLQDPTDIARAFAAQGSENGFSFAEQSGGMGGGGAMGDGGIADASNGVDDDSMGGDGGSNYDQYAGTLSKLQQEQLLRYDEKARLNTQTVATTTKELMSARKCAMRAITLEAKLKALLDKKEHIRIQKRKIVLQAKMDAQTSDLHDIERMSEALHDKFSELRHTQEMIRDNIMSTRSNIMRLASASSALMTNPTRAVRSVYDTMDTTHAEQRDAMAATHALTERDVLNVVKQAASFDKNLSPEDIEKMMKK